MVKAAWGQSQVDLLFRGESQRTTLAIDDQASGEAYGTSQRKTKQRCGREL